jgi:hypothetical protein
VQELDGLRDLALHHAHLLAHTPVGMIEHQIQIEKAGFQVAKRLSNIVDQIVEDLFGGFSGNHEAAGEQDQYNARIRR